MYSFEKSADTYSRGENNDKKKIKGCNGSWYVFNSNSTFYSLFIYD